ncbi:MAG: DUF456 domain-containing protein [Deltaproteobacteria bacterium]|nr:DUF456 domain-containing protein [Deltaproteobacteria bacterium]MBN2845182.1 DUF456 domain-containing protein [Deltaproteobacteria bacterium]
MTILLMVIGLLVALAGIIGCILPALPGPALSFLSLVILSFAKDWEPFGMQFFIVMGGLAALVTFLDYVVPAGGAKKYGASKYGVTGSIVGMLIGFFFIPPLGIFVGAFVGALFGEMIAKRGTKDALRAGWGVFVGIMVGVGLKLAYSGIALFFYIKEMF